MWTLLNDWLSIFFLRGPFKNIYSNKVVTIAIIGLLNLNLKKNPRPHATTGVARLAQIVVGAELRSKLQR